MPQITRNIKPNYSWTNESKLGLTLHEC